MSGEVIDYVSDVFPYLGDGFGTAVDWIVNLVIFIINTTITVFKALGSFFTSIFDTSLFSIINDIFTYMSAYIGTTYTLLFMALFGFMFLSILLSFVLRLIRGRINYDASMKKYNKYHPN